MHILTTMKNRSTYIFIINAFLLLFLSISCTDIKQEEKESILDWRNLDLTKEWQTGKTNAEGIDPEKFEEGITIAKSLTGFYTIGVVYKGRLVTEEYAIGDISTQYYVWSVTKSVLSALVGIAIDKGLMADEFQSFSSYYSSVTDSLKGKITVAQLLTMSSGIPDDITYMSAAYPLQFIMDKELLYPSGTYWNYTSAGTHVLSYIFTASTQESAKSFADTHLFPKLGITDYTWDQDAYGISNGGFGLSLRMRDMLKFGQLFLQKGKSAGQEIISSSWINKSTSMLIPLNESKSWGYGYLWWTAKVNGVNIYNALGYAGQFIIVVPSKALVIAATSNSVPVDGYVNDLYDTIMDKIVSSFSATNDK